MKDKVLEYCRRESLFSAGGPVVCAVSGGADSVALLHVLHGLKKELGIELSAAHYNHCLRGEESDEDEAFVRRLCALWNIPLTVERGDVRAYSLSAGMSLEEAARTLRYRFLMAQPGLIVTAHNADDQVETVLLNLLRGTGLKGLCAMAPRQERLIRPLLGVQRSEIEAYLTANGLPHREDRSNAEDDALRNRLRHHVTPLLRQENPALAQTVERMTSLLRQEDAYLETRARELLRLAERENAWDCRTLNAADQVLRRRAIRLLLPCEKPAMVHVEAVERLIAELHGSASVCLPGGITAYRTYDRLSFRTQTPPATFQSASLSVGQPVYLPEAKLWVLLTGPQKLEESVDSRSTFAVRYDMISQNRNLCVRSRRSGDVLHLPGGRKRLKELMIDRKIPAARRGLLPVIADEAGILAVFGLGADVDRMARAGEQAMMIKIWHEERENHDQ